MLWWYGFNASVSTREGGDGMKCCQKMKRRQQSRLDSIGRKCDTMRWCGDFDQRREHWGGEREETTLVRLT
jgi:hypothetical protein